MLLQAVFGLILTFETKISIFLSTVESAAEATAVEITLALAC